MLGKKEIYYDFKLHALVALDGYITEFSITDANADDRDAVWELTDNSAVNTLIGDKEYICPKIASQLKK